MYVRVTQIVSRLGDPEDVASLPAGKNEKGSCYGYSGRELDEAKSAKELLDIFHRTYPIGCLDDFLLEAIGDDGEVIDETRKEGNCWAVWDEKMETWLTDPNGFVHWFPNKAAAEFQVTAISRWYEIRGFKTMKFTSREMK